MPLPIAFKLIGGDKIKALYTFLDNLAQLMQNVLTWVIFFHYNIYPFMTRQNNKRHQKRAAVSKCTGNPNTSIFGYKTIIYIHVSCSIWTQTINALGIQSLNPILQDVS